MKHYVSVKSKLQPPGNPRAFDYFETLWLNARHLVRVLMPGSQKIF